MENCNAYTYHVLTLPGHPLFLINNDPIIYWFITEQVLGDNLPGISMSGIY